MHSWISLAYGHLLIHKTRCEYKLYSALLWSQSIRLHLGMHSVSLLVCLCLYDNTRHVMRSTIFKYDMQKLQSTIPSTGERNLGDILTWNYGHDTNGVSAPSPFCCQCINNACAAPPSQTPYVCNHSLFEPLVLGYHWGAKALKLFSPETRCEACELEQAWGQHMKSTRALSAAWEPVPADSWPS